MKQKKKRRPRFWIIISVLLAVIIVSAVVIANLPKHQDASNSSFDLTALADGTYQGECENGLVYAKVEVDVQNHTIIDIRILEHRNGMGGSAEQIIDSVVIYQSVEVDTVSGATYSSQTILKAVENALSK